MPLYSFFLIGAPAGEQANPLAMFLPLIGDVKKNDRVITIGGLHGTVTQVDETSVLMQADSNTKLRIEKSAISSVGTKE